MAEIEQKMIFTAHTPEDLAPVARALIDRIGENWAIKRTLILLSGGLGVGKTKFVETFVRLCAEATEQAQADVASPTFALHQVYKLGGGKSIHHFDLYRLNSEDELAGCGFWDVLAENEGLVFVEWPDKLGNDQLELPGYKIVHVQLTMLQSGAREISIRF